MGNIQNLKNTDLDFLDTYWEKSKNLAHTIKTELSKSCANSEKVTLLQPNKGVKMFIVKYSDVVTAKSWAVQDILLVLGGQSERLQALADKISFMIHKNRADSVKRMVEAICKGRIKKHIQINKTINNESLGKGHFRWNYQAYTLNQLEINHLKTFFHI